MSTSLVNKLFSVVFLLRNSINGLCMSTKFYENEKMPLLYKIFGSIRGKKSPSIFLHA